MLTATYSMVALSTEQRKARSILAQLQEHIHGIVRDLQSVNRACVESALLKLEQFETYCHQRKVEMYVIPAIRKTTHEADPILAELESLSSTGMHILRSVQQQMRAAFDQGFFEVRKLCIAMEQYCNNLWKRFKKEEEELLPIVRGLLPIDEWFNIAAKFLSDDAKDKRSKVALPTPVAG